MAFASGCDCSSFWATERPLTRGKSPSWLTTTCMPGQALVASWKRVLLSIGGGGRRARACPEVDSFRRAARPARPRPRPPLARLGDAGRPDAADLRARLGHLVV